MLNSMLPYLQLVVKLVESRNIRLETFACPDPPDQFFDLAAFFDRSAMHQFPMIEHALREGLALCMTSEVSSETERLHDGEISLDGEHGCTRPLLFREDLPTTTIQDTVDATDGVFGTLDLDEVDGLLQGRCRQKTCRVRHPATHGNNLSTTSMDGIGVKCDIHDVDPDTSHVLFGADTFLRCPLEGSYAGVFDFVEVLDSLRHVYEQIGPSSVGTKAPNLPRFGDIPPVLISQHPRTKLHIITRVNFPLLDGQGELFFKRCGSPNRRLCLFCDFERAVMEDSVLTVSR